MLKQKNYKYASMIRHISVSYTCATILDHSQEKTQTQTCFTRVSSIDSFYFASSPQICRAHSWSLIVIQLQILCSNIQKHSSAHAYDRHTHTKLKISNKTKSCISSELISLPRNYGSPNTSNDNPNNVEIVARKLVENAMIVFNFARHISEEARSPLQQTATNARTNEQTGELNSNLKVCDRQGKMHFN